MPSIKLNLPASVNKTETNLEEQDEFKKLANYSQSIDDLLIFATEHDCSDLYITVREKPYISRYGKIIELPCQEISESDWSTFYDAHVLQEQHAIYVREKHLDLSIEVHIDSSNPNYDKVDIPIYRYRAAFGYGLSPEEAIKVNTATFRMIRPNKITFDTINFNSKCVEALRKAYSRSSGICYCTGPTGSGKSTTLAACINTFTQKNEILDNKVIITLEDPIENLFYNTSSVKITQKEYGRDFLTFGNGIKAALREHPNVIVVGECRDKEVICTAIEASRTGHLTSTSFHAADVPGTLNRLLYHLDNDKNLSLDLILQLNIIMSQKMIKQNDRYLVDTQFLVFDNQVIKRLVDVLNTTGNVAQEIEDMIKDPAYQELGLVKDWDYAHLH